MAIVIAVAQGGEHVKVEELPMVVTFVNETPDTVREDGLPMCAINVHVC